MDKNEIKVLQVFASLNVGGAESRMMDIYRCIDKKKCTFDFVTMQQEAQYFEEEIKKYGGDIYKIASPRECGIFNHIVQLRKCMRMKKYDAVHAHTSYHCGIVMLAAKLEGIPVRIAHARTTGSKQKGRLKELLLRIGRILILAMATKRFAISKEAGEHLYGKFEFEVIPNAIDTRKYQITTESDIVRLKKELNIPENFYVIGQIGRFDSMKNHIFTVNWFSQYVKLMPKSFLVMVGDGPLVLEIKELVKKYEIENQVLFTGVRGDVPDLIHIFDVMIFPSLYEGLGGVVLEAQAARIPVVESDTVPAASDLGLGLVKRCSLNDSFEQWNVEIENSKLVDIPCIEKINEKFSNAGYSIEAVTHRYMCAYGGNK